MPHNPTSSGPPNHTPMTCWCCGRRATGIGMDQFGRDQLGDPRWLCELCVPLMEQIRAAQRFDVYENHAIDIAIETVGPRIEEYGADLGGWNESQVRQFVMEVIMAFGDGIRKQVRSGAVPF